MSEPQLRFKDFSGSWYEKKLSEIADIKTGPFGSSLHEEDYVETGTPIITVEHLGEQGVVHKNLPLVSDEDKTRLKSYNLQQGDVVFSRVGSVDRSCLISENENGWLFSGRLLRVRLTDIKFCSIFLNQIFKNETVKYRIRSVAVGQTMASLNTEILKNFSLIFPTSKQEQTKIANFLTAVDEKITQLTQKSDLLTQYKKGVMQQIFSQELRFKDDDGRDFPEWDEASLESLLDYEQPTKYLVSSTDYSDLYTTPVLTAGKTFILGYTNETKGIFNEGLPVIIFDDFTTAFKFVAFPFKAKSSAMKILRIKGSTNSIKYIYEAMELIDFPSGDEHKRYWISEYSKVTIPLPCQKEQIKIANLFTVIDDKITTTKAQLDAVKQYKQGLLQQMFV
jgi:type I restriction enzyme S subunit